MEKSLALIPLNLGVSGPVSKEGLSVDGGEFPLLVAALNGPQGDALAEELGIIISRWRRSRAERRETRVFARLLLPSAGDEPAEELVIVEDISRTGAKVAIPRDVSLDLRELATAHLVLNLGETGDERPVHMPVTFVREHGGDDRYNHVAFRFEDLDPARAELLDHVSNLFFT
jgi:hypothetical protein